MTDLRGLARERYRLTLDPSAEAHSSRADRTWHVRIPAKYGFVGVHGPDALVASCGHPRLFGALLAILGATVRQRGDHEIAVVVPPDYLDLVAGILQARGRRRLSLTAQELATDRRAASRLAPHSAAVLAAP